MERERREQLRAIMNGWDEMLDCTICAGIDVVRYVKDDDTFIVLSNYKTGDCLVIDDGDLYKVRMSDLGQDQYIDIGFSNTKRKPDENFLCNWK